MNELEQSVAPAFTRWPADGVVRYLFADHVTFAVASDVAGRIVADLEGRDRTFVLDFADAGYVDGRALEVFKELSQRIVAKQGRLAFENVNEDLDALLRLTHFDRLFPIRRSTGK
jgi:MFS superfamily sulfate permease-like transporter